MSSGGNPDEDNPSRRSLELGKLTAQGATALLGGEFTSKLIGVLGSLVLIRLLVSPQIYAPIAAATTLPGLVMLGDITGVNAAVTRTLSLSKREGNSEAIWSYYWVANSIKFVTGGVLSLVAYLLAGPISILIGKPTVEGFLLVASGLPIVWTVQVNAKSALLALGRARWYAWLQIINEILLSFAPIVAVLMGYGAIGALIAMVAANFAYLAIALAVSTRAVLLETPREMRKISYVSTAKKMVKFGMPQGLSGSVSTFTGQVINLIILRFVSLYTYGLYSVAVSANALMYSVNDPMQSMTFPIFSRIKGLREKEILRTVYRQSVRYSTIIILPLALFFIVFGRPFLDLFFGSAYANGGVFLSGLSLIWLTIGIGWVANLLTSQGFSKYTGSLGMLSSVLASAIAIAVVPTLGLLAYVVLNNLAVLPSYLLMVRRAKADLSVTPSYSYVKPFYGALLLSGAVCLAVLLLNLGSLFEVIAGALVAEISFLFFTIVLRGLKPSDSTHLRNMISSQTKVSKIANPVISLLDRTIRFVQRKN